MNTENPFSLIVPAIDWITNLKGIPLVLGILLAIGYMLKMLPDSIFRNRYIPWVNCLIFGPGLTIFLVKWPEPGIDVEQGVRFAEVAAWIQVYFKGFMLAILVWVTHGVLLKRFIDKHVPAWNNEEEAIPVPATAVPVPA